MLGLLALLLLSPGGQRREQALAKPKHAKQRPNVVLIETDDQTQASMSVMPETRELIGEAGVTFPNSFVNYSYCCPSRATILSGQYSHNHGVRENHRPAGGYDKLDNHDTLAVWLRRAGYYTSLIGKYLNGYERHRDDPGGPLIPPGWSEWRGSTRTYDYYGYELNEGGLLTTYGSLSDDPDNPPDPALYQTDVYTAKAVEFVNRRAQFDRPFFLWLSWMAPHSGGPNPGGNHCAGTAKPAPRDLNAFDSEPLPRSPSFNEADVSDKPPVIAGYPPFGEDAVADIRRYYRCRLAALQAEDLGVAKVIDALRASGVLRNTLVIFTSDNGFMHGEHRVKFGKKVPYEESIRVPLLIRGPGFRGGKTVRDLVINADLAKTIIRASGARPGRRMDGRALQGFARHPGRLRGRELSIETNHYTGVRTGRYIYVKHTSGQNHGFKELYDLGQDPFELRNVAADPGYSRVRSALAKRLHLVRRCSAKRCRESPRLALRLLARRGAGGCARQPVRATVKEADSGKVALAEFLLNGTRFARDRKRPFQRKLPDRGLVRRRASKVRVLVTLVDGRRMTIDRRVRACR